jgi:hypothetical protein
MLAFQGAEPPAAGDDFYSRLIEVVGVGGTFLLIFGYGMYRLEVRRITLRERSEGAHFAHLTKALENAFETQWQMSRDIMVHIQRVVDAQFELVTRHTAISETLTQLAGSVAELTHLTKTEIAQMSHIVSDKPMWTERLDGLQSEIRGLALALETRNAAPPSHAQGTPR